MNYVYKFISGWFVCQHVFKDESAKDDFGHITRVNTGFIPDLYPVAIYLFWGKEKIGYYRQIPGAQGVIPSLPITPCALHSIHTAFPSKRFNLNRTLK